MQRMFSDANVSNPADSRILRNYSLDDLDMESIAQYRQLFKLAKPDHPWSVLSDLSFLKDRCLSYRAWNERRRFYNGRSFDVW